MQFPNFVKGLWGAYGLGDLIDKFRLRKFREALFERFIPIISLRGVGGN